MGEFGAIEGLVDGALEGREEGTFVGYAVGKYIHAVAETPNVVRPVGQAVHAD